MQLNDTSSKMTIHLTDLIAMRQTFQDNRIDDPAQVVGEQMRIFRFTPRENIALAVGSRGIRHLAVMVKAMVDAVRDAGAVPFIVPAMGSHGGATAEGQANVLRSYGIDDDAMGAPIRSSMDTVELPVGDRPFKTYMDRHAWEADGVILINRVKPHTDFHDTYESGLVKMAVIGLGKHRQALEIHRFGIPGLAHHLPECASVVLATGKVRGGVAIVENAYDQPCIIEALPANRIMEREPRLLDLARERMPRLPVDTCDVLVVDRIGKDISGVGMDPNIIGRLRIPGQPEPATPRIKAILALDLSVASHGNAIGMGLADVITRRFQRKIDFNATYENAITSTFLERVKMPLVAEDDEQGLRIALRTCGVIEPGRERIIRIGDTLNLAELHVSPALREELAGSDAII